MMTLDLPLFRQIYRILTGLSLLGFNTAPITSMKAHYHEAAATPWVLGEFFCSYPHCVLKFE